MIEVLEPIMPIDQTEVVCPDVIRPGTYFLCTADVPRGTGLQIEIRMSDDVDNTVETTGWMQIPDAVRYFPGVLPAQGSYNASFESGPDLSANGFVLLQV